MFKKLKISHKIVSGFLITALVPLAALIFSFSAIQETMESQKINELGLIGDLKVEKLEKFVSTLKEDLETAQAYQNVINNMPLVMKYVNDRDNPEYIQAKATLDRQLMPFREVKAFLEFILIDKAGNMVYSTENVHFDEELGTLVVPKSGLEGASFINAEEIVFSEVFESKLASSGFEMLVSGPAYDEKGEWLGMIVLAVDMRPVYDLFLDRTGLGETGEIIVGKKVEAHVGVAMGGHSSELTMPHLFFITPLKFDASAALTRTVVFGSAEALPVQKAVVGEMGAGLSVDYRGESVVAAWRYVPSMDWGLVAKIDQAEAFGVINNLRRVAIGVVGGLVIFSIFLALILANSISGPVEKAVEVADRLGKGDMSARMEIKHEDELGRLGRSFNQMAESVANAEGALRREKEGVEVKIDERTKELNQERLKLLASISSLPLGFVMADSNDEVIMTNGVLGPILGVTTEEEVRQKLAEVLKSKERCSRCRKEGRLLDSEELMVGSKTLKIIVTPIKSREGIIGTVMLIEDITEEKIAEESKEEFFSVASHELRTPLTAIRGNASMLKSVFDKAAIDKDSREMVEDIYLSSVRLIEIVNDFLDVSRLEQGRINFRIEAIDLLQIINDSLHDVEGVAEEKGIYVKFAESEREKLVVRADSNRIKQVIVNLVGNGLKFSKEGGVEISVSVEGEFAKVWVKDSGIGISKENQRLLFRKFQQAGEKLLTRDATKGTGLGLYISKLLVEGMGGKIFLEYSEIGKGSVFGFTVPLAK